MDSPTLSMDPKLGQALKGAVELKRAVALWISAVMPLLRPHPEQMEELRKGLHGGEIRIAYLVRDNAIIIESVNHEAHTATEIFREVFLPDDGGRTGGNALVASEPDAQCAGRV
jgi:hypothetical protein